MDRRSFLKSGAVATAATTLGTAGLFTSAASAEATPGVYGGADLSGWETVVGDGIYARPGQAGVSANDIVTRHFGSHSELQANLGQRGIMAHNIAFKRLIDDLALERRHEASYEFRIPFLPTAGGEFNAQTFEGGFFIWDGGGKRKDNGLGFQWVLNPWMDDYGWIFKWSMSNAGWKRVVRIEPDTEWHRFSCVVDPRDRVAELAIDGVEIDLTYTQRHKPDSWGTETAARLQAEIISLDPGSNESAPMHKAEVRNWQWEWSD